MQLQQNCSMGKKEIRLPDQQYIQAQCRHRWKRAGLWKKMCLAKHLQVLEPTSKTYLKILRNVGLWSDIFQLLLILNIQEWWTPTLSSLQLLHRPHSTVESWPYVCRFWNWYSIQLVTLVNLYRLLKVDHVSAGLQIDMLYILATFKFEHWDKQIQGVKFK